MKTSDEITKIVFQKMADYKAIRKKQLIKYTSIISVFLVAIIAVFLFNINPTTQTPEIEGSGDRDLSNFTTDNPDFEVYIEPSINVSNNLAQMVETSELIVRGKIYLYKEYDSDGSGNFNFITHKHSQNTPTKLSDGLEYQDTSGSVYKLVIKDIIKGEAAKNILYFENDYDRFSYNNVYFPLYNPLYTSVQETGEYLFFLKEDKNTGYYMLATEPGLIYILSDKAYLHTNLTSDFSKVKYAILGFDDYGNITGAVKFNIIYTIIEDTITGTDVDELINTIKELTK